MREKNEHPKDETNFLWSSINDVTTSFMDDPLWQASKINILTQGWATLLASRATLEAS